jgi:hypothetical protein
MLSAKVVLLLIFVAATNHGAWQRLEELSSPFKVAAFVALWGVAAVAVLCVAFTPYRFWRYLWTVVLAMSSVAALSFWLITSTYLRLADVEQLLGLLAFTGNVVNFYTAQLLAGALVCALGIVALNMPPFWHAGMGGHARRLTVLALVPLVPLTATAGVLCLHGGEGADGLPVQFTTPAFAVVLGLERLLSGPEPHRKEVAIASMRERRATKVIVIMDESVRGDLLDINRPGGAYTGLLPHIDAMANFGIMSSIANCSTASNVAFRYGATRRGHTADVKGNPSIWQYAKRAGYRTIYIDGQRHDGRLHNLMSEEERAEIDELIQLPAATPHIDRDIEIARRLRRIIENDSELTFVYVNKMGAHFPYEGKYPPEQTPFQPVLKRISVAGNFGLPRSEDEATRRGFRNSYLNAIAWNVGHFFDTLLTDLDLANSVIVYMADHGQDLHEDGSPGYTTHCTTNKTSPMEGIVPLVVLTRVPQVLTKMREAAKTNRNRASQFNVFPSVLALLGYEPPDIARSASSELPLEAELPPGQQKFASIFLVRLGRQPVWHSINARAAATASGTNAFATVGAP